MALNAGRLLPRESLADARAGDCVRGKRWVYCLPAVINIGAQKAGTGELQTWLEKHPAMLVHGGEVHFFDKVGNGAACSSESERDTLRLKYLRFLWRRRRLTAEAVTGGPLLLPPSRDRPDASELPQVSKVAFEKTPAYMDVADPALLACIAPEVSLYRPIRKRSATSSVRPRACVSSPAASETDFLPAFTADQATAHAAGAGGACHLGLPDVPERTDGSLVPRPC